MKSRGRKSTRNYIVPAAIVLCVVATIAAVNVYFSGYQVEDTGLTAEISQTSNSGTSSDETSTRVEGKRSFFTMEEKGRMFPAAPEIRGISGYINTDDGITLQRLREEGKVVLVDFWTYSCINCQRTTPYLNSWYEKYADDGFVILGVHSPEFDFEKDYGNVVDATKRMGIMYPVVQDNAFETWKAYDNRYWPRKYIVDIDGFVRYDHIGEGAYDQTELVIQDLLAERADRLGQKIEMGNETTRPEGAADVDFGRIRTPEIYFGYKFLAGRNQLGNYNPVYVEQTADFILPSSGFLENFAYVGGRWYSSSDYMRLEGDKGTVVLKYSAKSVNMVAGGNGSVDVYLDGDWIGDVKIQGDTLYNLVSSESYGDHELRLSFSGDVRLYTFTFG